MENRNHKQYYMEETAMLTAKENMRQVILGGNPDRLVNQYEAIQLLFHPFMLASPLLKKGDENVVNAWGVTNSFPANTPGAFPVHTPDKIVIKDIENWRDYVKAPSLQFPDELWNICKGMYAGASDKAYKAVFVAPGLFEQCHHLMSIEEALMAFYEYPDEMHELIDFLADWELELAKGICENLHPDMLFHHDDWGSEKSSFISPAMFEEFILPAYKKIYGFYKENGILVVHHNDGYAKNLVPFMVEMGVDIWQGVIPTNDIPELIEKYGDKITFMGEIETRKLDVPTWTPELVREEVERACRKGGKNCFIPCLTAGMPFTVFVPGNVVDAEIDRMSKELFN